jgi:hypothetical protein
MHLEESDSWPGTILTEHVRWYPVPQAFKDFCQKVQAVAQTNDYNLDFDAPYKDLSFFGTPHREMVTVQFSAQCILNVSEMPFFVVPLDDIEHVHFERVTPASKNFDMVVILKDKEKDPLTVGSIPREFFIQIERTLLDVEVTFTYGPSSFRWKEVFAQTGRGEEHFYLDRDPDGDKKPAGWEFLLPSGVASDNSESEDDADSEFEVGSEEEEEVRPTYLPTVTGEAGVGGSCIFGVCRRRKRRRTRASSRRRRKRRTRAMWIPRMRRPTRRPTGNSRRGAWSRRTSELSACDCVDYVCALCILGVRV